MTTAEESTVEEEELRWPSTPSAIVIMGKAAPSASEHHELQGRIAMAAALWYSAPQPKPYIAYVATDRHGPNRRPDAALVKEMLRERFNIPADYIMTRRHSNCTVIEMRAIRVLARHYRLTHLFIVTHLYHAARTQAYANEVWPNADVIPVHPAILDEISFPVMYEDRAPEIAELVKRSQPSLFGRLKEGLVEWLLTVLHSLDRRGRVERWLAKRFRTAPPVEQ